MLAPIVEIFCDIDDYCKRWFQDASPYLLPNPDRQRRKNCRLAASEIITIGVLFHLSHYRTFKEYYQECVVTSLKEYFPQLVSYNHFLEIMSSVFIPLLGYLLSRLGQQTGLYYVDSTKLDVCLPQRARRHKTFSGIAAWGKTSVGWFFGLVRQEVAYESCFP